MICDICQREPGPGGTTLGTREASAVCHDCGIGLCEAHQVADSRGTVRCQGCAMKSPAGGRAEEEVV